MYPQGFPLKMFHLDFLSIHIVNFHIFIPQCIFLSSKMRIDVWLFSNFLTLKYLSTGVIFEYYILNGKII